MSQCEGCWNPNRRAKTYQAQVLDGSRCEIVLCGACHDLLIAGSKAPSQGCEATPSANSRSLAIAIPAAAKSPKTTPKTAAPDWRRTVYGGAQSGGRR